MRRKIDIF